MLLTTYSLIYAPLDNRAIIDIGLFFFGFASAAQCVTFGLVSDNNPRNVIGTAIGLNNMAVIAGGIILQPVVGLLLEYVTNTDGTSTDILFNLQDFQSAFILMPICTLIGLFTCIFFVKETHAKNLY